MQDEILSRKEERGRDKLVPASTLQLIEIFVARAEEMAFPGVTSETLQEHVDVVRAAAEEVDRILESLESARNRLDTAQTQLAEHTSRAHAYASVYAEDNPDLAESLREAQPAAAKSARSKTRRPKKERKAKPAAGESQLSLARDQAPLADSA